MALIRYEVLDPNDDSVVLGTFQLEDTATPEQVTEYAKRAEQHFLAKRVEKLSTPNTSGKIKCSFCPEEPGVFLDRGREFVNHMERHNQELNLGEKIQ